jgi:hypothetical protein
MPEIHCEACGSAWHSPLSLFPEVRREVAALVRSHDSIAAIRRLREETRLSLRDAKAVEHHISLPPGHCHRCGAGLTGDGVVRCSGCGAINYDW